MSLQEAASSGSFGPPAAQPQDPQRAGSPFTRPVADDATYAEGQATPPFANSYELATNDAASRARAGLDDMRAKRRRAWTVIGLAVVIPAAVAGIIAWQLFDGDAVPTPTVTRVITPPAQSVDVQTPTAAATPAATSTDLSESATALDTTVTVTAVTTSDTSESEADTPIVAVAEPAQAVDLSSLDPAARLAAWTDIERIQVVSGESLWLIAHTYETTVSAIATLNGITDSESLSVGQELVIPVGFGEEIVAAATPVAVDDGGTTTSTSSDLDSWTNIASVTVEDGDSLDAIARANNTSIEAIMALNGLTNSNLIYVGDVLRIPVGYQGEVPGIDLGTQKVVADTQVSERTDEEVATPTTHGDDILAEDDEAGANDMLDADDGSHSYSMSE